jgi:hypothetical protein
MSTLVGEQTALELETPECGKGIGKVILAADSKDLIAGVRAYPYPVWPDDRGYFFEIARMGQGLTEAFPKDSTQVSAALSYPGTIKAFHFHRKQTDCWVPVEGMLQVKGGNQVEGLRPCGYISSKCAARRAMRRRNRKA